MPTFSEHESIITADRQAHSRMRRAISHAFSEKALHEQESILKEYADLLISRLRDKAVERPQNLVNWFNWTTFDLMGELTYSQPFGCLKEGQYHEWVQQIFLGVKGFPWMQAALHFKIAGLRKYLTPASLVRAKDDSESNSHATVDKRLLEGAGDHKDFMSYIVRHSDHRAMTPGEIKQTSTIMMIAGSETTATYLSGFVYLVLRHPKVYNRLLAEIRGHFDTYDDITLTSTNELKYLPAVVAESFRYYPPSPNSLSRIVPGAGEILEGSWVPGDTTVAIFQWAAHHDFRNFYRAADFLPERYLAQELHGADDVEAKFFLDDKKQVVQPFSFGPRVCLGKR